MRVSVDARVALASPSTDGRDHMGEHKDDEEELVRGSPIASLSLGQARDFVFRHQDARAGAKAKVRIVFLPRCCRLPFVVVPASCVIC